MTERKRPEPIPLTVLTGFLGAGKTTLLNRLLQDNDLSDTAVLINEFGEIGLDHLLVEQVGTDMVLLASGCLCCTVRGDLVTALEKLLRDLDNGRVNFRRIIIETTGLADPAPVLHTIMAHPYLVMRYRLDGVVTLIDAVNGNATLDAHVEAVKQLAVADRIVVTKTDLPEAKAHRETLLARIRAINPVARILDGARGEATAAKLLDAGLYNPDTKTPDVKRWLAEEAHADAHAHHHHGDHAHHHDHGHHQHAHDVNRHDDHIRSFVIATDQAVPAAALDMFFELLRSLHGPNLLRLKGIVRLSDDPDKPLVVHGVQHIFHPPTQLPAWPDGDRRTRLVFIVRDLDSQPIRDLFNAFINAPAIDRPDRAALLDNPLVPFGGRDR
ncbi:putative GTP-binding protein YjiA [Variibacter gotjawalensis]|uniref:Putative GTP-binding protein YjiA n=1 Tax=Variibacter gotjawalensis TaxID=1333996 RepID=A0A0S3PNZ3_9BRAD|nr:GTP-binding protein [Variibacter gotjawalensis]NIK47938.1 G3E family GTPase [Variibacter gotjawalensis]RZS49816.1 G3E family GTPase [Variibacter gotjawalensis]BAT57645.1 putative GTP-binding protein YjiA [Variibacter gotjawalensis]